MKARSRRGRGGAPPSIGAVDRARRRLAALMLGTPWAGALAAAGPDNGPGRTKAESAATSAATAGQPAEAFTERWVHAFAAYGPPKYGPEFKHFEYVNPGAPRGGTIRLRYPDRRTSFDKYNPWTTRGNAPAGILIWMVETLGHLAADEPSTVYGLLAEAMFVARDFGSVSFRIRREARFSNGDPVTPADVVHSYAMLSSKGASPAYQTAVGAIAKVVALDERTVRFDLKEKGRDQVFSAATMPVFSRKWGAGKPFDQITTEIPILSGPYLIDKIEMPRRIEFRFNPHYWGRDLPLRRGHFNFERVVYRSYQEHAVAREAFKAGEFDLLKEYGARSWLRLHAGPKWDDGRIKKRPMRTAFGQGLQSYQLNLRRPIFQDVRVREALGLTYDFDTLNKTRVYKRAYSVFSNSEFAAEGLPGAGELKLLEPLRAEVPPAVFGPAYRPPTTAGDPNGLRKNLLKARALLEAAGWKLDAEGELRNAKGERFEIELLTPREGGNEDWARNFEKLGIRFKERTVDFALYRRRLEKYDYDFITIVEPDFTLPSAADLAASYGSKSAAEEGNNNFRGVRSKAVDALIEAIGRADTMAELRDAARALDRVIMWSHYQIPDLYGDTELVSVWDKFGIPEVQAKYFAAETLITGFVEFGPWPLWCWWDRSLESRPKKA
jgi:peptide/nickel transport system substrate-binding protein/microcin C transport system substrate-binding protein